MSPIRDKIGDLKSEDKSLSNPEFPSTIFTKKGGVCMEKNRTFEWVKVRAYPILINGKWAFETLYKKVYH